MRALVQRVSRAGVTVDGSVVAAIGKGLLIFIGVGHGDTGHEAGELADKIANLRIFEDDHGKMNLCILDTGGEALVVSQFTLYADAEKGRRPSFTEAAAPAIAEPLVTRFAELLRERGVPTSLGAFGAHMLVEIWNDGPVTIWLERTRRPAS